MTDWNDLQFVLAISRRGTLIAAARELKVEHSTVSRRLAALQKRLGVRLFNHTPRGYRLTCAGRLALTAIERRDEEIMNKVSALALLSNAPASRSPTRTWPPCQLDATSQPRHR